MRMVRLFFDGVTFFVLFLNIRANYYNFGGIELAHKILNYIDSPEIWIQRNAT